MSSRKSNFTLAFDNQLTGEMLKTFMACQKCNHVNTKNKLLKCTHTVCMKCAVMMRRRQQKPGHWAIQCLICSGVTHCYGDDMTGLKESTTVQKLVDKASASRRSHNQASGRYGPTPNYTSNDMSVSIVSSSREKQEIQKVFKSAQEKVQICHSQAKQVENFERKVKSAKLKIEKQIRESVEAYISAIRSQEDQLLDELKKLFQEELQPVKEANACIDMQMQSIQLVTQCCSVAGRILKGGGAPMDMDSFKRMVRQTMSKINGGKLPSAIQKTYKPRVYYKTNEDEYDELAERLGVLSLRRDRKKENKKAVVEEERIVPAKIREVEEEPIYDLPPEWESKKVSSAEEQCRYDEDDGQEEEEEECFYDEIPFYSHGSAEEGEETIDECPPEPVKKDHPVNPEVQNDAPLMAPSPSCLPPSPPSSSHMNEANVAIFARRQAMCGSDSEWDDSTSDDELAE